MFINEDVLTKENCIVFFLLLENEINLQQINLTKYIFQSGYIYKRNQEVFICVEDLQNK